MPGLTSPQNYPYPTYEEANNPPQQIKDLADAINFTLVATQNQVTAALTRKNCSIAAPTNQSIPNNAYTNATFTTELLDNDNMVNLGVDNTLITIVTAGVYVLSCDTSWPLNATGNRGARFIVGGNNAGGIATETVNADTANLSATMIMYALAGTTVRLQLFQNSGGALNSTQRRFSAVRMSG